MKKFASIAFATVLASTGTAALAEQDQQQNEPVAPVAMTDAQMDQVTAGAPVITLGGSLISVDVNNVANNNDVVKDITVNAAVAAAVGVLSRGTGAGAVVIP